MLKNWLVVLLMMGLLMLPGCGSEDLAATVNGEPITMTELDEAADALRQSLVSGGFGGADSDDPEFQALIRSEALDNLIQERVLLQELQRRGIELDFERAEEYVDMIRGIYGDEMFESILVSGGSNPERFLREYAFNQAIGELYAEVTGDVQPDPEDIREAFELNPETFHQGQASHILILLDWDTAPDEAVDDAQRRAADILSRLNAGEDFAEVARETSDDGSAEQGGRLEQRFSMLESPFVDPFTVGALSLSEGEFTQEPVISQFGLHIIRLDEKITDFEELRPGVERYVTERRRDEVFRQFVNDLRDAAEVDILIEWVEEVE